MLLPFKIKNIKRNQRISFMSYVNGRSILENDISIKRFCKIKNVKIGKYSYISNNSHIINCEIGRYCSIGPFVKIGLGKHPIERFSTSPLFYSPTNPFKKRFVEKSTFDEFENIKIGNDVWIGANAIVLDGVKIGNGAIIAAGAVVTKNVPDFSIVGGVPAKIIKYRFDKSIIEEINKIQWWNLDIDIIYSLKDDYTNTNRIIKLLGDINEKKKDKEKI